MDIQNDAPLDRIAKQLDTEAISELAELGKLVGTVAKNTKKMSEASFVENLLPYIIGEVSRTDVNDTVYVANYLEVSGGYRTPITVVDADGNTLFELPPIIVDADISSAEDLNFNLIINKFKSMAENHIIQADRMLKTNLDPLKQTIAPQEESENKYIGELRKIFIRYADRIPSKVKEGTELEEETYEEDFIDYT